MNTQTDEPNVTNSAGLHPDREPATDLQLLTNSRLTAARACLRKHQLAYEVGLRPVASAKPLRFGSGFHAALEAHANGVPDDDTYAAVDADYEVTPAWADAAEWAVERETLKALASGHFWRYSADQLEYVAVERQFRLPLTNPETGRVSRTWVAAGKIDAVVRLPDGRLAVLEYKTTADDVSPESDYWLRLRYDGQISLYVLAARHLGFNVDTVLYDVTRKPAISPKLVPVLDADGCKVVLDAQGQRVFNKNGKPRESASTENGWVVSTARETPEVYGERLLADIADRPDFYFARREVPRLESDLEEFRHELWQQAQQLRQSQLTGRWFRNVSRASCGTCAYKSLCLNGVAVDPASPPAGFEIVEDVHQELAEEVGQ